MQFIDTHSHLYSSQFDEDRTQAINDAISAGVSTILLPNISSEYTKGMLEVCGEFPENCFPMIPSGKAHNEMLLGDASTDGAIDAAGSCLV